MKNIGPRIFWGGKKGIKLEVGSKDPSISRTGFLTSRCQKYSRSTKWGKLHPRTSTLWHISEGQDQMLWSADSSTSGCSRLNTWGYFWMSILIYFEQWCITWTIKNIISPDSTSEKTGVGNYDFNYLWKILLDFGLEEYGLANAKESIWPPNIGKGQ